MREILFRGKRVDGGEWIYGHYVHQYGANMIYLPDGTDREYGFDCYHIIPETVGQYTGLTDKNGKKIFEGDILEVDVQEYEETPKEEWYFCPKKVYTGRKIKALWSVEYKEHRCRGNGFYVYGKDRRFNTTLTQSTIFNSNPVVIGNIHDNPELMKGK